MIVTRGLIIADPWIGHILSGGKIWGMRSQSCSIRGMIGLIRKGTGAVWGAARLYGVGAPLSPDEMVAAFDKHAIPEEMIRNGQVAGWNVPWKLSDIVRFEQPVPYAHKSGAVTFVIFDEKVGQDIARQMGLSERTSFDPIPVLEPRRPAPAATKHREPAPLSRVAPTSSRRRRDAPRSSRTDGSQHQEPAHLSARIFQQVSRRRGGRLEQIGSSNSHAIRRLGWRKRGGNRPRWAKEILPRSGVDKVLLRGERRASGGYGICRGNVAVSLPSEPASESDPSMTFCIVRRSSEEARRMNVRRVEVAFVARNADFVPARAKV